MEMQSSSDHEAPDTSSVPPPPPPSDGAPLQDHALLPQSIEHPVAVQESEMSEEEVKGVLEAVASTGKFWQDWEKLKGMLSWWLKKVCSGTLALCLEYILSFYSHPDDYSISLSIRCALKVLSEYPEARWLQDEEVTRVAVQESEMSEEEVKGVLEAVASTGKFWQDWEKLKGMLSWWLKKVCSGTLALCLEYILSFYSHPDDYSISLSIRCALKVLSEYPEVKMTDEQQKKALGETYSQLVNRLDEALLNFDEGPPFTLQRLCEVSRCGCAS
ncbi:hypothetical protein F2Q70_00014418 [Brassica cretica]|uniref:Uncharacterized protein n=1 Tax=Brassica cretica TaxID=69181 RepID=A0A8S9HU74_BRACR|nr:hypothetical protein F2Q70_00014418 [Brassica cretica]